jgi:hypothetical protein
LRLIWKFQVMLAWVFWMRLGPLFPVMLASVF